MFIDILSSFSRRLAMTRHDSALDAQEVVASSPAMPPSEPSRAFVDAYSRWVYRFRWGILVVWVLLLIGSVAVALPSLSNYQTNRDSPPGTTSSQVDALLTSVFHQSPSQIIALFQSGTAVVTDASYQRRYK